MRNLEATSATPLLKVTRMSARYGRTRALHDLSIEVHAGEIVVMLGANGAGKTTTLRAISGTIAAEGSIRLDRRELIGVKAHRIARRGVAHVPQGRGTFGEMTVDENLRIGSYLRRDRDGIAADRTRLLDLFPALRARQFVAAAGLSGGEQQMLAISRALMLRPRLLLLDEPSLGLAPLVTRSLFDTLGVINRELGTAMLIVEQNASIALELASRAYVLEVGHLSTSGTADELRNDDRIRLAYLGF